MGISLESKQAAPVEAKRARQQQVPPVRDALRQRKNQILTEWLARIRGNRSNADGMPAFPAESPDRFADPVAYALLDAAEAICSALIDDCEADRGAIGYAMKIKAVQGGDVSEAVGFIRVLGSVVRARLSETAAEEELKGLELRIGSIEAAAAALFLANRARIAELARNFSHNKDSERLSL